MGMFSLRIDCKRNVQIAETRVFHIHIHCEEFPDCKQLKKYLPGKLNAPCSRCFSMGANVGHVSR